MIMQNFYFSVKQTRLTVDYTLLQKTDMKKEKRKQPYHLYDCWNGWKWSIYQL